MNNPSLTLATPKEPYDLELPYGVIVTVEPLTQSAMLAAQATAKKRVNKDYEDSEREDREGLYQAYLIYALAERQIKKIIAQGQDAPVTPENVITLMDIYPIGETFFRKITLEQVLLNAAKNGFGVSANGTTSQAEAPNTAEDAKN